MAYREPQLRRVEQERLACIAPELARRIRVMIATAEAEGLDLFVVSGLRDISEQTRLFAQGRTQPGPIVTHAPAGQSWHNFGLAVDLAPMNTIGKLVWNTAEPAWNRLGQYGEAQQLEWGGRWPQPKRDLPHLQLRGRLDSIDEAASAYHRGTETHPSGGLPAVWAAAGLL